MHFFDRGLLISNKHTASASDLSHPPTLFFFCRLGGSQYKGLDVGSIREVLHTAVFKHGAAPLTTDGGMDGIYMKI